MQFMKKSLLDATNDLKKLLMILKEEKLMELM